MSLVLDVRDVLRGQQGVERICMNESQKIQITLSGRIDGLRERVEKLLRARNIDLGEVDFIQVGQSTRGTPASHSNVMADDILASAPPVNGSGVSNTAIPDWGVRNRGPAFGDASPTALPAESDS